MGFLIPLTLEINGDLVYIPLETKSNVVHAGLLVPQRLYLIDFALLLMEQ
jgi:hypothetical protein